MKKNRSKKIEETAEAECLGNGWERFFRRLKWIFSRSGVLALSFEHFLAMVPATILVPILVNNSFGETVIDMSLVLFTSGLGTIVFIVTSKGKIPAYVGSSFAYIGLTIYLIQENMNLGVTSAMAYSYVGWTYAFSGVLLVILSLLYKSKKAEKFMSIVLPASVVGPAISLIGLELADTAVVDSGFDIEDGLVDGNAAIIAIGTLVVIVVFSLIRHKIWKNTAIIAGMLVGYIMSLFFYGLPNIDLSTIEWFTVPDFHIPFTVFPPNLLGLFVAVIPSTLIVFTENIGRVTVIDRMTEEENDHEKKDVCYNGNEDIILEDTGVSNLFNSRSVKKMRNSVFSHGLATIVAAFLGSVPNTLYAENIAVMSIHKTESRRNDPDRVVQNLVAPFSVIPYIIAAVIAILFSFLGVLQSALVNIPKPVIGGMELFLFGIISAPGIQLLVEQRVNYKKVSNQIITAAVLISGVSGLSVSFGFVELKGMGLGFLIGVILNLIVLALKWIGNLSDTITFEELISECLHAVDYRSPLRIVKLRKRGNSDLYDADERNIGGCQLSSVKLAAEERGCRTLVNGEWMSGDYIRSVISNSDIIVVGITRNDCVEEIMQFRKTANGLFVDINSNYIDSDTKLLYLNDYTDSIDEDGHWLEISVSRNIPMRRIQSLVAKSAITACKNDLEEK